MAYGEYEDPKDQAVENLRAWLNTERAEWDHIGDQPGNEEYVRGYLATLDWVEVQLGNAPPRRLG